MSAIPPSSTLHYLTGQVDAVIQTSSAKVIEKEEKEQGALREALQVSRAGVEASKQRQAELQLRLAKLQKKNEKLSQQMTHIAEALKKP